MSVWRKLANVWTSLWFWKFLGLTQRRHGCIRIEGPLLGGPCRGRIEQREQTYSLRGRVGETRCLLYFGLLLQTRFCLMKGFTQCTWRLFWARESSQRHGSHTCRVSRVSFYNLVTSQQETQRKAHCGVERDVQFRAPPMLPLPS